ncbi:dihydroxyacetone kinase DhaL subunit [Melghirimyces profundicolus]|uniref:phosphoenolpyruvate--glycerone phosphotransferase n=1 Tax=Melghirimyces profundicolus TaxID=1242148 RepID=A0A2T6BG68_9BACL|nr:dihydroxyacetone kinase subunit DhaL [Melghirimyces profundicolus]PTX55057.1 dihydroxyacetone kinase DhaL subunit [Melghirimyces profundicolus]
MNAKDVAGWFQRYADVIEEKKAWLTELDSAVGDGDHGANMARGWKEVRNQLKTFEGGLPEVFLLVSRTLISKVGGASGPLYGTAFLRMSMFLKGKEEIGHDDWPALLKAASEGIGQRGKVNGGEKTMYDVWAVVSETAEKRAGEPVRTSHLLEWAREKAEAIRDLRALKGRAAYLGDRSVGHRDPGAESTVLLFETLHQTVSSRGGNGRER